MDLGYEMFCYQCEQTAGCGGCTGAAGVCGKTADVAKLQDELNGALVGYGVDYVQLGEATADMVSQLLCDGKTPADLPYQTFDNGIVTINTETAEALGLDLAALKEAFKPYCTEICEVTTAENFS